ncbi:MAG: hypothetical protein D6785_10910, partial [Planctomycetota bacterium]
APALSYVLSNTDGPFMKIFEKVLLKEKGKDFVPKKGEKQNLKVKNPNQKDSNKTKKKKKKKSK